MTPVFVHNVITRDLQVGRQNNKIWILNLRQSLMVMGACWRTVVLVPLSLCGGKQGFLGSHELRRKAGARLGVGALVKGQEFLAHEMQRGLSWTASKFVLVRQITASPPLFRCASSKGGRRFGASPARIIALKSVPGWAQHRRRGR